MIQKLCFIFIITLRNSKAGRNYMFSEKILKVYFNYEDNALFVFDIIKDKDIILVLNTKKQIRLRPQKLFLKDDDLFMQVGEDRIKFVERGLIKISDLIEYENKQYFIRVKNRRYKIHELK